MHLKLAETPEQRADKLRFIELGWTILEAKAIYYGAVLHLPVADDDWYDEIEAEYVELAAKLNEKEYSNKHVGFPADTGSGRLVLSRLQRVKKKDFKYSIYR